MDRIVNIYRSLCLIPALVGAKLDKNGKVVHSTWSHRNLEKSKTTKYLKHILLYPDLQKDQEFTPIDVSNELLSSFSPSEKFRAVLRENEEKQYLEIWKKENLFRTVDLSILDIHGKVYCDGDFATFQWSPYESKLLYIAEEKVPDSKPFYKRKSKEEANDEKKSSHGQEYIFRQDWGEQMVGKKKSVIVEYNVEEDKVNVLEGIPDEVCPGQVKYSPDGEYVVGVGYATETRKLGLIYCSNRAANIFKLKDGKYGEELIKKVSDMNFYAYRLMIRADEDNTILRCRQLFSQYIVDMYDMKIESERLRYIKFNQTKLRAEEYIHLRDAVIGNVDATNDINNIGSAYILPSSYIGSPRHMQEYIQDAMAYVRAYGRQDLFITFTCNPNWDEIQSLLLTGQTPMHRHDITARVFKQKLGAKHL